MNLGRVVCGLHGHGHGKGVAGAAVPLILIIPVIHGEFNGAGAGSGIDGVDILIDHITNQVGDSRGGRTIGGEVDFQQSLAAVRTAISSISRHTGV